VSNQYFDFRTVSLPPTVPGSKARSGEVNRVFDAIEAAFDMLPTTPASLELGTATLATESGSGNSYVVTMPNTRTSNANGDEVVFRATHSNSGASTLQVDAISAVTLSRFNGDALVTGDIVTGRFYAARYDSANSRFVIVWPAQVTTVSGAITYATPSNSVSLAAAAEGVAATVLRSDVQLTLSQSIAPTWTGIHTFSNTVNFDGAVDMDSTLDVAGTALLRSTLEVDGAVTFDGAANFNGAADFNSTANFDGAVAFTSTAEFDGSVMFDAAVDFDSTANFDGTTTFTALGTAITAPAVLVTNARPGISINETDGAANNRLWGLEAQGEQLRLFAATDAGTATNFMTVDRTAGTVDSIAFAATNWTFNGGQIPTGIANPTGTIGLTAVNGVATTVPRSDSAPALSQAITPTWTAAHTFTKTYAAGASAINIFSASPTLALKETDAAANNQIWLMTAGSEQWQLLIANDAENSFGTAMTVDRTGTTVDSVTFPTTAGSSKFVVGTVNTSVAGLAQIRTTDTSALSVCSPQAGSSTMVVHNEATAGDNTFIVFQTEAAGGTGRGSITYNRGGGVVAYNTTCRERFKANIRASAPALPLLAQIPIVAFDWRNSDAKMPYFVTYERLENLVPWACQNDGVDVSKLVPLAIKALQELTERVVALESPAGIRGEKN
jgi:hypothetical protein